VNALLLALVAAAQIETAPPPPEPPRPVHMPRPVQSTLPNGLRVIVAEKHNVPLVAARLLIASGAEADPAELPGVAEMTATMLTKGTTTRTAQQIARGVEVLGATLETGAGWDASFVAASVMSSKLSKAMGYMADVVLHPAFAHEELERERQRELDAIRLTLKNPGKLGLREAAQVVFGNTPYGRSGATLASAEAMKREDLVAFQEHHYGPNNAILILAGDVTPAEGTRLAEEYFGSWKRVAVDTATVADPERPRPRVVIVDLPNAPQAMVLVSRAGLARSDPQYAVAQVTNAVLGGGFSSRLSEEIRIKRGLSYGAHSFFDFRREGGPFTVWARTKNESTAEVARLMTGELSRMSAEPVAAEELTPRKAALIGTFARPLETNAGLASLIGELALYGIDLDEISRYIPAVDSVTSGQVQEFAREHLGGPYSIVIAGDAQKLLDAVKKEFPAAEVVPAASVK
jgi:zinc protease